MLKVLLAVYGASWEAHEKKLGHWVHTLEGDLRHLSPMCVWNSVGGHSHAHMWKSDDYLGWYSSGGVYPGFGDSLSFGLTPTKLGEVDWAACSGDSPAGSPSTGLTSTHQHALIVLG